MSKESKLTGFIFFFKKAIACYSFFFIYLSIFLNLRHDLSHFSLEDQRQNNDTLLETSFSWSPVILPIVKTLTHSPEP